MEWFNIVVPLLTCTPSGVVVCSIVIILQRKMLICNNMSFSAAAVLQYTIIIQYSSCVMLFVLSLFSSAVWSPEEYTIISMLCNAKEK